MPRGRIQILPPQYKASIQPRTEILAFCNELAHLRAEIKRLEGLMAFKDEKLVDTARFFEDVLRENKPQSIDRIKRLISLSLRVALIGTVEVWSELTGGCGGGGCGWVRFFKLEERTFRNRAVSGSS